MAMGSAGTTSTLTSTDCLEQPLLAVCIEQTAIWVKPVLDVQCRIPAIPSTSDQMYMTSHDIIVLFGSQFCDHKAPTLLYHCGHSCPQVLQQLYSCIEVLCWP